MKLSEMLNILSDSGLLDESLSKRSGVSVATISRLRRGKIENCRIFTAEAIRKVYEQETNTIICNYS